MGIQKMGTVRCCAHRWWNVQSLSSIVAQAKPALDWERVMAGVAAEEARIAAEEANKSAR